MRNRTRVRTRRWGRIGVVVGATLGAGGLLAALAVPASAEPPANLPQQASALELEFAPVFDYDTDGCYNTPAIGPDGTLNGGLNPSGALNGNCRDASDLANSQVYSRSSCNNGWCAIVYAGYFEKDQAVPGSGIGGHRHDWEHVISWVDEGTGQVEYVTTTQHSSQVTYPRSQVVFDGRRPKIVYHKDGISTHFYRLAGAGDEPPENHHGTWFSAPLVGWDGWPDTGLRDTLTGADFGAATIKISDGRFEDLLAASKPEGVPFVP